MMVSIFTAGAVGITQNVNTADAENISSDYIWKSARNIKTYIDPNLTTAQKKAAKIATSQWHDAVPGLSFTNTDDESSANIVYSSNPAPSNKSGNTHISLIKYSDDSNWYLSKATVETNLTDPSEYSQSMQRTYNHETGHALGLNDTYDKSEKELTVMYGVKDGTTVNVSLPQKQDIETLNNMYGF
ncbi:hypothetical protein FHL04_08460 [Lactobacillus salsicarnum]|nr:hypothetical protein [Companilactobacillus mishanensis]